MSARVDCLICQSPPILGIRQLLRRRRRELPHPNAQHTERDEKQPTRAQRDDFTSYLNSKVSEETHDVDNRSERENGRRDPQASSLCVHASYFHMSIFVLSAKNLSRRSFGEGG
jgi:hypothetical protein